MTDNDVIESAWTTAEMAPHGSATAARLADREPEFPDGRLSGPPPVARLDGAEAPAYILTDSKRGVGLGTKRNRTPPGEERGTVVLVTSRRTLAVVGREADEGRVFSISHESLAGVEAHTGLLAHRLLVETPDRRYHCWVSRGTDGDVLAAAADYLRERLPTEPTPLGGDEAASTVTYRGRPVPAPEPAAEDDDETTEAADSESTVTYRGQEVDESYLR